MWTRSQGLSPAISIDQKTTSHNPRSTVGTVTEIYDYLRLLYARIGIPHCPVCGRVISQQTVDQMVDAVLKLPEGTRFQVLAPVVRAAQGHPAERAGRRPAGAAIARVRIDGNLYDLDEEISLEKNIKHTVEIVVDRLVINEDVRSRLADSLETALALTGGIVDGGCHRRRVHARSARTMPARSTAFPSSELAPRMFSLQQPASAPARQCTGLGTFMRVDPERHPAQHAISPSGRAPSRPAAGTMPRAL